MTWLLVFPVFLGLSLAIGSMYLHQAERWGVVDVPSNRSSHASATPRGGGLAFVVPTVTLMLGWAITSTEDAAFFAVLAVAGVALASVGLADDRWELPASLRLVAQGVCVAATLWVGVGESLLLTGSMTVSGPIVIAMAFVGAVWFINLYNFMDGLDGLAAVQAMVFGFVGAWLLYPGDPFLGSLCLALAAGVLGFLRFNWAPARMFMGDTGSLFLGFVIVTISLRAAAEGTVPLLMSVLPVSAMVVDATATLVWRVTHGRSPVQAHREHAYQWLHQIGWAHSSVSLCYGAVAMAGALAAALAQTRAHLLLPMAVGFGVVLLALWSYVVTMSKKREA